MRAELEEFRVILRRWQATTLLPIDQMILTLGQDLFTAPNDLALAHKLALVLHQVSRDHADWRLPELNGELSLIARNERRFLGFSEDDAGFDPSHYAGKVVVTTMHKAKGLEWDRVYLMSVNNYDFPSLQPNDRYISEKWFVRDSLNLEAETLAQLQAVTTNNEYAWYEPGQATQTGPPGLRARTPAPALRGHHPGEERTDHHLEYRPHRRTNPGAAFCGIAGMVGSKKDLSSKNIKMGFP